MEVRLYLLPKKKYINILFVFVEGLSEIDQFTLDIQGLVSIKGFNQSGNRYEFLTDFFIMPISIVVLF